MGYVLVPIVSQFASLSPAERFAIIIGGLCQALGQRVGGPGGLPSPFLILIWTRLRRLKARFARLAATPPPSRPARRRTQSPRDCQPPPLPRHFAWLLRLVPETAPCISQLRHFLSEPDVASLLAETPQLGRILRPLCRALGIRPAQAQCLFAPPAPPSLPPDAAPPHPTHAPPQAAPAALLPVAVPPQATSPPRSPRAAPPVPA